MEGIIETLVFVVMIATTGWYYNHNIKPQEVYVMPENEVAEEVLVDNNGSYFCPVYCGIANHTHIAHYIDYDCGLDQCNHKTFVLEFN